MRSAPLRAPWRTAGLLLPLALALAACADQSPVGPRPEALDGLRPTGSAANLQATPPGSIRIGVVPSTLVLRLGSSAPFVVKDKATGATLIRGAADEEVLVELAGIASVRERDWMQAFCTGANWRRDQLIAQGIAAGFEARYEQVNRNGAFFCWRIYYGTLPPNSSTGARAAFQSSAAAAGLLNSTTWATITEVQGETTLKLTHGGAQVLATNPVVLEARDGIVRIGERTYRGVAEAWVNSTNALVGINELPLEEYLYGVVPNELPPVPYGEPEAQKAQAVAARTYAIANLGKRRADGYDLLPTTSDQVYRGYGTEHPVSTAAVDATRGVVAVHQGTLITTLYHSTSGGYTANSEDVYTSRVDYLRGVPDAPRGQALEHVPSLEVFKRHANPTNLRAAAEGDYEADWSRYHRWVVEWTAEEMARVLSDRFTTDVTEVTAITVTDRADHGRVREIVFQTDAGPLRAHKDNIRTRLGYIASSGDIASLRSTLFYIEPVLDRRTRAITGWKAYGGGWGHGVGMSQTGAVGMAERGATYEQILKHYYRGIELETR